MCRGQALGQGWRGMFGDFATLNGYFLVVFEEVGGSGFSGVWVGYRGC